MTFLISDGVFPTNDGRGYVLRRIIRRAVLRAAQLGVSDLVTPTIAAGVIEAMGVAYPALERDAGLVRTVLEHEEEAFRRTLRAGTSLIEEELGRGVPQLAGEVAFRLHDTFGFPIELTDEIARARGVEVDRAGFEIQMELQRSRARAAGRGARAREGSLEQWRAVLEEFGPSTFVGYRELSSESRVLAVLERDDPQFVGSDGTPAPEGSALFDLVLASTPFYAEGGGQDGDTGSIVGPDGELRVLDTQVAIEGLVRHTGYFVQGSIEAGSLVTASVDAERRAAIRRNHTATHLLQAALRRVSAPTCNSRGPTSHQNACASTSAISRRSQATKSQRWSRSSTTKYWRTSRSAPMRRAAPRPKRVAPSPFSGRSTATSCASSRQATSRSNCVAARTSSRPG